MSLSTPIFTCAAAGVAAVARIATSSARFFRFIFFFLRYDFLDQRISDDRCFGLVSLISHWERFIGSVAYSIPLNEAHQGGLPGDCAGRKCHLVEAFSAGRHCRAGPQNAGTNARSFAFELRLAALVEGECAF